MRSVTLKKHKKYSLEMHKKDYSCEQRELLQKWFKCAKKDMPYIDHDHRNEKGYVFEGYRKITVCIASLELPVLTRELVASLDSLNLRPACLCEAIVFSRFYPLELIRGATVILGYPFSNSGISCVPIVSFINHERRLAFLAYQRMWDEIFNFLFVKKC